MKTIFKSIIVLAGAALLAACAVEDTENIAPKSQTYTMTGNTGMLTRVEYKDVSNTLYCKWEVGDVVNLKSSSNNVLYAFTVTEVDDDGLAKMSYEGNIPNSGNFTGTATYAPKGASKARVQSENGSTAHLKYGEVMVANLDGQQIDGANLNFTHPSTAVYRVTFKAPVDFPAGSMLTIGGAWSSPASLELRFGGKQNDIVIAYIIYNGGQLSEGDKLKFSLAVKGGDVYSYEFTSSKSITYETGKYWLADISERKMQVENSALEGLKAVDLGLSVKWANMNLGANRPEDYGDYFDWGETDVHYNTNQTSRWVGVSAPKLMAQGVIDSQGNLTSAYDAATKKWGQSWRLPTHDEIMELKNKCTWEWAITYERGYTVTGTNGNSIFLPAAGTYDLKSLFCDGTEGFYFSSTVCSGYEDYLSYVLWFTNIILPISGTSPRDMGRSIRPVSGE